jgi:dTDP-4-amino-4,6-dideoxygalactose transaminase
VGREQLKRLPGIVQARREIAERYVDLLASIPGIVPPAEGRNARSNWQSYCVRLPDNCDQRTVMQSMLDAGVATRRGIMNSHREDVYRASRLPSPLVESEAAQDHCILLPLYPQMTREEQAQVVDALRRACGA